jgi:hypothetical protein
MSRVEFKPTTQMFDRGKIVYALERAATAINKTCIYSYYNQIYCYLSAIHSLSISRGGELLIFPICLRRI